MVVLAERKVQRRDGSFVPLDVTKIKAVVDACTNGLNVNSLELESGVTVRLRDGISTKEIQANLIECALRLTSLEAPAWRYVAGRLLMWGIRKDTTIAGFGYDVSFRLYVYQQVQGGIYDRMLLDYSDTELDLVSRWIVEQRDWDYDYAGASLWQHRYLLPNELPQQAYLAIALLLALPEKTDRLYHAQAFYAAISQRKISLATPILLNLRRPGGNLASCFIAASLDSRESIFQTISDFSKISQEGGGAGINLSRVRCKGSWVRKAKNASGGVVPWVKILNDTAVAVNQGGKRAGAVTIGIDIWHMDVPDFLDMQTEHGDQRKKCYDVFPQLIVPDEFMRRVQTMRRWVLVDPYEVRTVLGIELAELWGEKFEQAYGKIENAIASGRITLYREVDARDLFKQIMRCQFETGLPYLAFKDAINRANPNQHVGYIPQVNLCTESFSNVVPHEEAHTCNLASLNLANVTDDLKQLCDVIVRLLDNTIEMTVPPIKDSETHNCRYRTIGAGVMGLADWLAKRGYKYSENVTRIESLQQTIAYYCINASADLAIEKGAYPLFKNSQWMQGRIFGKTLDELLCLSSGLVCQRNWLQLVRKIQRAGIRNSQVLAIAPNTSTALLQGCTASILPPYARINNEQNSKGSVPISPPYIEQAFWFYEENKTLDQQHVVNTVAALQRWVDTGVSMELVFNPNLGIDAKQIFEIQMSAWEQGVKAIYYVRTIQQDKEVCDACAG